ncbi:MAG: TonB-dependent receptor [Gammaproteobacteria bacterium]
MPTAPKYRLSRACRSTAALTALSALVAAQAQAADSDASKESQTARVNNPDTLEELVISASRMPQEWRQTSSSVSVISLEETAKLQVPDLKTALEEEPGVIANTTGAIGGTTSVYIRGAFPQHTLLVVDGIRMNDRAASYDSFMGAADLSGMDRVEVLRGPQSTLYGSAAIGGVIVMNTAKGADELTGAVGMSGGSFETYSTSAAAKGSVGALGYSGSVARYKTANDLPSNDFDSWNYSTRLNYALSPELDLGVTYRRTEGDFHAVGSRTFYSPGLADTGNDLATLYTEWRPTDAVTTKLTAGYHQRDYTWLAPDSSPSVQKNERKIIDWQTAWKATDALGVVAGANYESSDYTISGSLTEDTIKAGFLSGTYDVTSTLTVTAGARIDDYDSVGSAFTWRSGVAWMVTPDTKLRATYGTGFSAPGSSDRYGVPAWGQLPNPDLVPEKARGWDAGVDQSFLGGSLRVSATYFGNRFTNLIDWEYVNFETFEGTYANRNRASTDGVELGVTANPVSAWHVRLGYTYLDAKDDETDQRLTRRPRNSVEASTWLEPTPGWVVGVGVQGVYDSMDTVTTPAAGYTIWRMFSSYDLGKVTFKVRAENLSNKKYDEVLGYAALPFGVFGSVEWKF